MNWYDNINIILDEIENSLTQKIEYKKLAMKIGVSDNTLMKIFSFIIEIPIGEYIRKRRLTEAYKEIINGQSRIIDIAIKYNYNSEFSFSRAFKNEFKMNINEIKSDEKIVELFEKYDFNKYIFKDNKNNLDENFDYKIIQKDKMTFYGNCRKLNKNNINQEAKKFFYDEATNGNLINIQEHDGLYVGIGYYNYIDDIELIDFYIAGKTFDKTCERIDIKSGNWVVLKMVSKPERQAIDMYTLIQKVYNSFLNKYEYKLCKNRPCIEYYYSEKIEFWLPIEL